MSHAAGCFWWNLFFSSLSCVVGILCVWGAFISSAWCPTPDPQRQMLQDCKTCNCREFLESNANHTALGVCVCLSFFIFSSQKCIFLTVPASFNAVQGVERKTSQTKQLWLIETDQKIQKGLQPELNLSQADRWYLMSCKQIINWLSEFHSLVSMATEPAISRLSWKE